MDNKQSLLYLIPKSTYYHSKQEVIDEGAALHDRIMEADRELYAYLLYFTESTYYSKSLIMERLLRNSLHKDKFKHLLDKDPMLVEIEDALIYHALFNENITHALKILLQLKKNRINNSRTQKLILRFIFDRGNADYLAIKYKNKIKQLLIHALSLKSIHDILEKRPEGFAKYNKWIKVYENPYDMEVFDFVFDKERDYTSKYLQEYVRIRNDFKNNTVNLNEPTCLPKEVLEGFNNFYQRNINLTVLLSMGNLSDKQKIQLQNTAKRHSNNTMELKIDLKRYSMLELLKYMYSKEDITEDDINECWQIINDIAKGIRASVEKDFMLDLNKTAVIADCSLSHSGSGETKMHPFFKNLILMKVFANPDKDNVFLAGGKKDKHGLLYPAGETDLSTPLLEAVEKGFENIIVLSDGFENVGHFDKVYKQLKTIGHPLNVVHFNPVFSPRNFSFKSISDDIVAFPFTSEKDIQNIMLFYLLNTDEAAFKQAMRQRIESELLS